MQPAGQPDDLVEWTGVTARSLALSDGRVLDVHVAGVDEPSAPSLVFLYGTPHTGRHPAPVVAAARASGLRLLSVTRPGYGASPRRPGRTVLDCAADVHETLDQLGIARTAVAGYSGGGPHALALAVLLGDRATHVATFASPAPYDHTPGWFTGMAGGGGGLRPAADGRAARERHQQHAELDPESFTADDLTALSGPWAAIGQDAQAASSAGSDHGEIDDDLAFVAPWGVDLATITARCTLFHGADDRIVPSHHAERLAELVPTTDLRLLPGSGHVAVLDEVEPWMRAVGADVATTSSP
ncbi:MULTISPECIES: alpha/beta hydrolase [unclassified Aeromicrobium]|uniref:alpha/beta fold hydrolase n=1 Tax=unclassified Aeromicrobium TaxID=2633570 RepID=UPI00288B752D|nr:MULTISPECIES: alpha/beta hydrolase [unclassified Aeromicrobium]